MAGPDLDQALVEKGYGDVGVDDLDADVFVLVVGTVNAACVREIGLAAESDDAFRGSARRRQEDLRNDDALVFGS